MMLVATEVRPSAIHGIGLFATQFIPRGTVVWRFNPALDVALKLPDIGSLDRTTREFIRMYGYWSKQSGRCVVCTDNARFFNHADKPNTRNMEIHGDAEPLDIAIRDIASGEELTANYWEFDQAAAKKLETQKIAA
jgi:SET domain-containing protein